MVSPDIAVVSPELLFVQMGTIASLPGLVRLGYELCGTYVLDRNGRDGFRSCSKLSTPDRLASFVNEASGLRGVRAARCALRRIAGGSASPAETLLAMLLCMPVRLGGYGLPLPSMNRGFDFTKHGVRVARRRRCRCDLMWPAAKLCIEYNSRAFHSDPERMERDAARTDALQFAGIMAIVVTPAQLFDVEAFDGIAHVVARRLGHRLRVRTADFSACQKRLREQLFDHLDNP